LPDSIPTISQNVCVKKHEFQLRSPVVPSLVAPNRLALQLLGTMRSAFDVISFSSAINAVAKAATASVWRSAVEMWRWMCLGAYWRWGILSGFFHEKW